MTQIIINDLESDQELDRQALKDIKGGILYYEYGQGRSSSTKKGKYRYYRGYEVLGDPWYDNDLSCGNLGSSCHRK